MSVTISFVIQNRESEDAIYALVVSGVLEIDTRGRIWRVKLLRNNGTGTTVPCERRRADGLPNNKGYLRVGCERGGGRVFRAFAHRLVFRHFKGEIPDGITINHKDNMRTNNDPDNLELATFSEQSLHMYRSGARVAKVSGEMAIRMRERRASGESVRAIAADCQVSRMTVYKVTA